MKKIQFIKLGGSVITDKEKPYTKRGEVIKRLIIEIGRSLRKENSGLFIGNGGGSYAHTAALKYQDVEGKDEKDTRMGFAEIADSAARLNRIIVSSFIQEGFPAIGVPPSSVTTADNKKLKKIFLSSILEMLNQGLVPVVYGDVVVDRLLRYSIISTEKILSFIISQIPKDQYMIEKMIYVTNVDGVLDTKGRVIEEITTAQFSSIKQYMFNTQKDVTGGMIHKVSQAIEIAKKGVPVFIINGLTQGLLQSALEGKKVRGTIIHD